MYFLSLIFLFDFFYLIPYLLLSSFCPYFFSYCNVFLLVYYFLLYHRYFFFIFSLNIFLYLFLSPLFSFFIMCFPTSSISSTLLNFLTKSPLRSSFPSLSILISLSLSFPFLYLLSFLSLSLTPSLSDCLPYSFHSFNF